MKVIVGTPDNDTEFFDNFAVVLQSTLASFPFIILPTRLGL